MGDVLAFVELREGSLRGASLEVVSAATALATKLGGKAHALVLGGPGSAGAVASAGAYGAEVIKVGEHEALASYVADGFAPEVAQAVREGGYSAVLFAATAQGTDLAPRVAALLGVPRASEVTSLEVEGGKVVLRRPIYSGKAFARLSTEVTPVMATLRPNAFALREQAAAGQVESFAPQIDPSAIRTRVVGFEAAGGDLDVSEASVVGAGGRGMKEPDNWNLIEALRDALGTDQAALGASRAVVDAGWRPHGEQVGQTGKTVAPKLYFAVGISGAIQHLAGMRTSGTIVAINKDADAPIFQVADYGIVGDALEVLPRLSEEVARLRAGN